VKIHDSCLIGKSLSSKIPCCGKKNAAP